MNDVIREDTLSDQFFMNAYKRYPVNFTHGEGCYLYDTEGKEYLDFLGGIAVNALGHAHPEIIQTAYEQMCKVVHTSNLFYNTPSIQLAKFLTSLFMPDSRAFFCNSGAEAAEFAIKICRYYGKKIHDNKTNLVAVRGSFHGRTTGALAITGPRQDNSQFSPLLTGISFAEFNDIDSLLHQVNEETAGIFIEPVQGEGGIRQVSQAFLQKSRELADQYQALLVYDEVQCGMGRTGYMFTQEYHHVKPDIVYLAKALGVGFPIGAVLAIDKVAQIIKPGDHGCTFGGNPFVCAIALKFLEIMENDKLLEQIQTLSPYFLNGLQQIHSPLIQDIRGFGYMFGIQVSCDPVLICQALLEKGLISCAAQHHTIRFLPPYVASKPHFDQALSIIDSVLKAYEG